MRCAIHLDPYHVGYSAEVGIAREQGGIMALRDRGDHAVDETSRGNSDPAALAVDACGAFEVRSGIELEEMEAKEKSA